MIDDEYIIRYFYGKKSFISSRLNKIPSDIEEYLKNRYANFKSFKETIYRIKNKLDEEPKCLTCGKNLEFHKRGMFYRKFCNVKCSNLNKEKIQKEKITKLNKYNNPNYNNRLKCNETKNIRYGNTWKYHLRNYFNNLSDLEKHEFYEKIKNSVQLRYNVNNVSQLQEIKDKKKQTCLIKYGITTNLQAEKTKNKLKSLRKDHNWLHMVNEKINETKRRNGTFNTSRPEEYIYERLCEIFTTDNVIRQHHTDEYPFDCDFYIIPLNLYIEYQGMWTHNDHPFDETNENDLKIVESWSQKNSTFYNGAIDVWTKKDVLKRNTAKKNNLNWIEFFNLSQFNDWVNQLIK